MRRIICLLIGYLCGNFLTAEAVARFQKGRSAFSIGSGNPGMANMAKQFGIGTGAMVLAGDLGKTFIACLICRWWLFHGLGGTAAAWAGVGVVLGHDFPMWHRFQGGKGVACTCAALICVSLKYGVLACLVGLAGVLISGYLALGAVLIPIAFLIPAFLTSGEMELLTFILVLLMYQRNRGNLEKIRAGQEPKTDLLAVLRRGK
ncbi:MAG: glycerol-3-phosphate acyltransferase [Oscillospiraceae bacterium]|nr:glycerol-3-phosphate acyltransferase [Oscillospiraceae bacterium]